MALRLRRTRRLPARPARQHISMPSSTGTKAIGVWITRNEAEHLAAAAGYDIGKRRDRIIACMGERKHVRRDLASPPSTMIGDVTAGPGELGPEHSRERIVPILTAACRCEELRPRSQV